MRAAYPVVYVSGDLKPYRSFSFNEAVISFPITDESFDHPQSSFVLIHRGVESSDASKYSR